MCLKSASLNFNLIVKFPLLLLLFVYIQANEDCNCYSFDMRLMKEAKCVHQDHVSAVWVAWLWKFSIVEILLMCWLDFRFHCCANIFKNLRVLFYCRMDIDYSPTGREFVTGSYDRTVSSFLPHFNIWFWSLPLRKEGIHVIVRIHCHFSGVYYHNGFFFFFLQTF